jgi:hypothetical protein
LLSLRLLSLLATYKNTTSLEPLMLAIGTSLFEAKSESEEALNASFIEWLSGVTHPNSWAFSLADDELDKKGDILSDNPCHPLRT